MNIESKKYDAYGIRLEILKNAKEMVWDAWHMENNEARDNATFENIPYEIPPLPTTQDVLTTASEFYDFVENYGENS
tara:strand:+ start:180 stop:410 length:231 start_codon:yes stop_codon:yes gene_type:complete